MIHYWTKSIYLFILSLAFLGFSCAPDPSSPTRRNYEYQLSKESEVTIELDSESSSEIFLAQYMEKGDQEWLFTLNHLINAINIYTLPDGQLNRKVYIPREGPQAVLRIQGFLAFSPDSLLILPRGHLKRSILVDSTGRVLDEKPLKGAEWGEDRFINHASVASCPPIYYQERFHFVKYPSFDLYNPANMDDQYEFALIYDTNTEQLEGGGIHFPPDYQQKIWSPWATLLGQVKGHGNWFVYNWPFRPDLYVTDFQSGKWVDASISPRTSMPESFSSVPDEKANVRMMLENVTYRIVYYDPFRQYYYRFASLPIPFSAREHRDFRAFDDQPLKIVTLNKDFEIIAETRLPGRTYDVRACFVGKSGLYIPQIQSAKDQIDEDHLIYSVYQITPISQ